MVGTSHADAIKASTPAPTRRRKVSSAKEELRSTLATALEKMLSSPLEATPLAEGALRTAELLRDVSLQGEAALVLADCYQRQGELSKAQKFVEQALSLFEQAGQYNRLGKAYKLQATLYTVRSHSSLALAAAGKALTYPDLTAAERAHMFRAIAVAMAHLFGVPAALEMMQERALPEADLSADPGIIVNAYALAASFLHVHACWALDIPYYVTMGSKLHVQPTSAADYLKRAEQYLSVCAAHLAEALPRDHVLFLDTKGLVVSLTEGFSAAQPFFSEARAISKPFPLREVGTLIDEGRAARIDQRWDEALSLLSEALRHKIANVDAARREIHYELSHVYRALGETEEALRSLETFTQLHADLSVLAQTWIKDSPNLRRYGKELDLERLRSSTLKPIEPVALKRATQYIEKNLDRRLTLPELARHARISSRRLRSLFQQFRGVAVGDFVRERKMQRVKGMLEDGGMSVQQVADAIGYSSAANFSRDFRKRFGLAPTDVRDAAEH